MSGMSKEFLDWAFANGYCAAECYHKQEKCGAPYCDVAMMWPEIRYSTLRLGIAPTVRETPAVTLECVRNFMEDNRPWGPPFTHMVTHTLIVPMPDALRDSYERERVDYIAREQLKERIAKVIDMCQTTRDIDLDMLPNQIIRVLLGEDNAT